MKAITALTRFLYGFSIKYPGQTSAKEPMPYPSPTTLVGALAAAIGRSSKHPEIIVEGRATLSYAATLLDKVVWAVPALLDGNAIPFRTLTQTYTLVYQRSSRQSATSRVFLGIAKGRGNESKDFVWPFSATVMGWMHYDGRAYLTYIAHDHAADEIAKAAWGIVSVGSKESLMEVEDVTVSDVSLAETGDPVTTPYPVPLKCVKLGERGVDDLLDSGSIINARTAYYIPLTKEAYTRGASIRPRRWLVPYNEGYGGDLMISKSVIRKDECLIATIGPGEETIVLPRR